MSKYQLMLRIDSCWLIAIVALLQACATAPLVNSTPDHHDNLSQSLNQQHLQRISVIQSFSLKGRIGVQTDKQGFSGGLQWLHHQNTDEISLYSPLGGQVSSIERTQDKVTLVDAQGNSISAVDAETLTQNILGWQLPLTGLADWSLGRPTGSPIQASTWDEQGRLITLKQDSWDIGYSDYMEFEGYQLPSKIVLKSTKVNIKLIVENRDSIQ